MELYTFLILLENYKKCLLPAIRNIDGYFQASNFHIVYIYFDKMFLLTKIDMLNETLCSFILSNLHYKVLDQQIIKIKKLNCFVLFTQNV